VSGDIVERLRFVLAACDHCLPNGVGDSFSDPISCGRCLRLNDAVNEIERLRQWKAEATTILAQWEDVVEQIVQELDLDDTIGRRKTDIVADEFVRLRAEIERLRAAGDALADLLRAARAEIVGLRAAGDALAEWLLRIVPDQDRDLNDALTVWEESQAERKKRLIEHGRWVNDLIEKCTTLTADLAAERAISDELFACTYASLESGRLERARDAWREARRER
jgi:hypothetical protein